MKIEPKINFLPMILSRFLALFVVLFLMKVCEGGLLKDSSWWIIMMPILIPLALLILYGIVILISWLLVKNEFPDDEIL